MSLYAEDEEDLEEAGLADRPLPAVLTHHSWAPLAYNPLWVYEQEERSHKPRGLWLSRDGEDDWQTWCLDNDYNKASLAHRTEFRIAEGANLKVMRTVREVLEFSTEYAREPDWRSTSWTVPGDERPGFFNLREGYVDWTRIAKDFDGVLIEPYIWPARMDRRTTWYYSWDVASACIWNLAAIELIP